MRLLLTTFLLIFFGINSYIVSQQTRLIRSESIKMMNEKSDPPSRYYFAPLVPEGGKDNPFYLIGPEISTQLSGYHDFQSNGECKHYVNRYDQSTLHAVYMLRTDSAVATSRRTGYAFSTDNGATFTDFGYVPSTNTGHPSLTVKSDGSAVICNYYSNTPFAYGGLFYDVAPGAGTFTRVNFPAQMLFPGCARLSNNYILTIGIAHPVDTVTAIVYNTSSNTFGSMKKFYLEQVINPGTNVTYAAGPNGKALIVLDPYADEGGNFGLNRLFMSQSTDNGVTWSSPSVLYDPQIISGDTVVPFFGIDAIYDASGDYYIAFNSIAPSGLYSSAKLWVIKNGGAPKLVAQHSGTNGIPEAANSPLHSDAGMCTIDHPSLSLSAGGLCIYIAYAVQHQNDTLNGFNKAHIYFSSAKTSDMVFAGPIRITNGGAGSFDERFPSLNQDSPNGLSGPDLYLVYQKDPQPGSCVNGDNAPTSRSTLMFRNIFSYLCDGLPGIKNIGNEIPETFALYQNFPNPFNPVTKIRFAVPVGSNVTLKIFNSLGQLVSTLVSDEQVTPGLKEIDFNASLLASGIYFYNIEAKSDSRLVYNETKKMVMVK